MSAEAGHTADLFTTRYQDKLDGYTTSNIDLVASHFGVLSKEEVNQISEDIEQRLLEKGEKKGVIKRIFSILIESLQNVRLHGEVSEDDGTQHAYFVFGKGEDNYHMAMGNLIFDKNKERVIGKLEKINVMDKVTLKEFYMETLTDGEISSKGGAGLGFITIAMKSKNPVDYEFEQAEEGMSLFAWDSVIQGRAKDKE